MTDATDITRQAAERIFGRLPFGNVRDDTRHEMISRIADGIKDILRTRLASCEAAALERAAKVAKTYGDACLEPATQAAGSLIARAIADIIPAGASPVYAHPDGGRYVIVERGELKRPDTGAWVNAIAYRDIGGGQLYMTTLERWDQKFTRVALTSQEST